MLLALIVRDQRKIVDSRIMVANADKSEQEERRSKFNQRTHPYKWVSKNRAHNKKSFRNNCEYKIKFVEKIHG